MFTHAEQYLYMTSPPLSVTRKHFFNILLESWKRTIQNIFKLLKKYLLSTAWIVISVVHTSVFAIAKLQWYSPLHHLDSFCSLF